MPRSPQPTVCAEPGCPTLTTQRRCPNHTRHPVDYRPSAWQRGYNQEHRALRNVTAKTPCNHCGAPWEPQYHLDHVNGNNRDNRPENLQWLCHPCHSRKTIKHDGGFGQPKPYGQ